MLAFSHSESWKEEEEEGVGGEKEQDVCVCVCDHLCPGPLSLFTSSWRFLTNLPTTLTATPPPPWPVSHWPNREPVQTHKLQ